MMKQRTKLKDLTLEKVVVLCKPISETYHLLTPESDTINTYNNLYIAMEILNNIIVNLSESINKDYISYKYVGDGLLFVCAHPIPNTNLTYEFTIDLRSDIIGDVVYRKCMEMNEIYNQYQEGQGR